MDFEKLLDEVKNGKKIDSKIWKKLTKEQKEQVKAARAETKPPKDNDWKWYAINEQIARDIANIPFNVMSGVGFLNNIKAHIGSGSGKLSNVDYREMGVYVLPYLATCGVATQKVDGINMAATQLYTSVRRKNSGARNYEAADLMMYILGMRDVYKNIGEGRRILGLAGLYDIENHYLPDLLLNALGIDATDLRQNLAQYRGRYNLLVAKANALAVPKYFKAFERTVLLTTTILCDSTTSRGQFYMYKSTGSYIYSATASTTGTQLTYQENEFTTFGQFLDVVEQQLNALFLDDDVNTMSGDIVKAFEGQLHEIAAVNEGYVVPLLYEENLLNQIENTLSVDYEAMTRISGTLNITQSNQLIKFNPTASPLDATLVKSQYYYLNSHKDKPDFTDILDWTRNMTIYDYSQDNVSNVNVIFGLELFFSGEFYYYEKSSATGELFVQRGVVRTFTPLFPTAASASPTNDLLRLSQFDWHPFAYVLTSFSATAGTSSYTLSGRIAVFGDLKKFAKISQGEIQPMHEAAVTAAFWADEFYKAS